MIALLAVLALADGPLPAKVEPYRRYNGSILPVSSGPEVLMEMPSPGTLVRGSKKQEQLKDSLGGNTLIGGDGDDTYVVIGETSRVRERAFGGVDTIQAFANFTLPPHVETLVLRSDSLTGRFGSAGGVIVARGKGCTIVGGRGSDVMVDEGEGRNIFAFSPGGGRDVIQGFKSGNGERRDLIQLRGYGFSQFEQIRPRLSQSGDDVLLALPRGDRVLLRGVRLDQLGPANFLLELDLSGYRLTFEDDFDTLRLFDRSKASGVWTTTYSWGPENGPSSNWSRNLSNNGEKQLYVDPTATGSGETPLGLDPFRVRNGKLEITASRTPPALASSLFDLPYVSGLINTRDTFSQFQGYFEARVKVPPVKGMFPAFWLLPAAKVWPPEIDIFENVGEGNVYHGYATARPESKDFLSFVTAPRTSPTAGFHTYGVLWGAETLTWYVDRVAVGRARTPADMHMPMYLILNLAVAGHWAGDPPSEFSSATMVVDSVRVYQAAGQ